MQTKTKTRILSTGFKKETNGFSGNTHPTSGMYKRTMQCMKQLKKMAEDKNESVGNAAIKVLSQSQPELDAYIRSRNEVPVDTLNGMILQAALLRMEDISTVARAGGISEADALAHVFEGESEAYNQNTAEKGKILTPSTQAAIMVVYNNILSAMKGRTGAETMGDSLDFIRQTLQTPRDHTGTPGANNFNWGSIPDNFDLGGVFSTDTGYTGSLGGVYGNDTSSTPAPTTDNSGDTSSSVWDLIDNVVSNAGNIADAIKKIGAAGSTAINQVGASATNVGSNIGSQSISKYVSQNWKSILLFILVVAAIIIIMIRVSKHK